MEIVKGKFRGLRTSIDLLMYVQISIFHFLFPTVNGISGDNGIQILRNGASLSLSDSKMFETLECLKLGEPIVYA